jgi:hypothetical protein
MLTAIAIPNFLRAREISQRNACYNNLRQIEMCKEQATLANGYQDGKVITGEELTPYLGKSVSDLTCHKGGKYTLNPIGKPPVCSEHGSWEDGSRLHRTREDR